MSEFDVLIQNARIVDGSGKPAYRGSIGVKGDRVLAVGDVKGDAKEVIDASKLTAVPGFIDSHSHGDGSLPYYPLCENYVLQGVTAFVGGQCGISPAPIGDMVSVPERLRRYFPELSVYKYYPERTLLPRDQVNEFVKKEFGWTIDWHTMGDYFNFLEKKGFSINYAPVVGHGAIRRLVMGEDYMRHSNKVEQAQMAGLIRQTMDDGCIGMSVGMTTTQMSSHPGMRSWSMLRSSRSMTRPSPPTLGAQTAGEISRWVTASTTRSTASTRSSTSAVGPRA